MLGYFAAVHIFTATIACIVQDVDAGSHWAVLVAGSSGYQNYRHQADLAHAYNVLIGSGVDPSKMITFSVDDIARNTLNPQYGKIFHDDSYTDYYDGLVLDYVAESVSAKTFLSVLAGGASLKANDKKILDSGPDDNVFIYFTGYGGDNYISFPRDILLAQELNDTITMLYKLKKYAKLVLYIDSQNSASMFERILSRYINVYAVTSASHTGLPYAMYCNDTDIAVCIASEFSQKWASSTAEFVKAKRTMDEQLRYLKTKTWSGTVRQFGDPSIGQMKVADFFGPCDPPGQ